MLNGGFDLQTGEEAVVSGFADAIVYGRLFIANPDLVERYRASGGRSGEVGNVPMNPLRAAGLYGGAAEGYTDYPRLAQ